MSHRLIELFYVADIDYSWLAKFMSLLVLPAAHEDLAILLGGYLVVNRLMPVGIVVVTIYLGMVASDLLLYAIGAGARRIPWLSRLAVNERVAYFGGTLQRNLFGLAALGRVVPGAVFVIMIACGWTRVPWTRVALASLFSSALYLPLVLYLVIGFGEALVVRRKRPDRINKALLLPEEVLRGGQTPRITHTDQPPSPHDTHDPPHTLSPTRPDFSMASPTPATHSPFARHATAHGAC